jgi:hypothetical protein
MSNEIREQELLIKEREIRQRLFDLMEPLLERIADVTALAMVELDHDLPRATRLVAESFDRAVNQIGDRCARKYESIAAEKDKKPPEPVQ